MAAVDDQVAQAPSGGKKFPDDDSHQSQADVDLGGAEHDGDGAGQDHLAEGISLVAPQSVDQGDLFAVYLLESRVKADDGSEQGHGYSRYHDGGAAGAQPHDEKRRQGRLRQAVQDHQVWFGDLGQLLGIPQQRGGNQADQKHQQETDNGLHQCDAHMQKQRAVQDHAPEAFRHQRGTGEKEAVDPAKPGAGFPQGQEEQEEKEPVKRDLMVVPPVLSDKGFLRRQFFFVLVHDLISSHN